MVDTNKLRGLIAEKGLTGAKVATLLNISSKTFYTKMKTGAFRLAEVNALVAILGITNPEKIFFRQRVTCNVAHTT